MPLWTHTDQANGAPRWDAVEGGRGVHANGQVLFNNNTPSAFVNNMAVGTWGTNTAEANTARSSHHKVAHAGWQLVRQGTGFVNTIAINNNDPTGTYANLAVGTISNGTSNATFTVGTNSTGGATSVTLSNGGTGFINGTALGYTAPANGIYGVTINSGGTNFSVGDLITFSNGQINATATVASTKATNGAINSVTFTSGGRGFVNTADTVVATTSTSRTCYQGNIVAGGTLYANTDTVKFSNGTINAQATVTTNTTGGITSLTFSNGGGGFINNTATAVTINTATGSGATITAITATGSGSNLTPTIAAGANLTLTITLGGRAGRVHNECLVALSSLQGSSPVALP